MTSTCFNKGVLPFTYLGIPIFKGRVKATHLNHISDKILAKLSAWNGFLLSMAGRFILVKAIIHNMISYAINIYSCWMPLLRKFEQTCNNFIWSRDIHTRELFVVSCRKTCQPRSKGDLGLRSLVRLNEATNLKLVWNLRTSKES